MQEEPLISVIVPVYNVETFLLRCLESIASQTYHNLEIILVDDGSTDGSGKMCDAFAEKDSRSFVIHQTNKGLWYARNVGQNASKGDYLMFVDGDDYLHVDAIKVLYEALIQNPSCGLAMCKYKRTLALDEDVRKADENKIEIWSVEQLIYNFRAALCTVVWNKLYRRSLIFDIMSREYRLSQDLDYNLRVYLRLKSLVMVDRKLYFWMQRNGSTTNTKDYRMSRLLTETDIYYRNFIENRTPMNPLPIFFLRQLYIQMLYLKAHALGTDYEKKAFLQCSEYMKDTRESYLHCPEISLFERCGVLVLLYQPRMARCFLRQKELMKKLKRQLFVKQ